MIHVPPRAQFRRVKGWRMVEGGVLCCRPGPLGNPFKTGDSLADCEAFDAWAREALGRTFDRITPEQRRFVDAWRDRVRKATTLYCACRIDQTCHVDKMRQMLREGY